MIQERLKEIEGLKLYRGSGKTLDTACVMQVVSYIAGEKWTDHPECACPILTWYCIRLNDAFNDEHRQRLKPFIPLLVGTRSNDETQIARKRLLMWRNVTATYPLILDLIKLNEYADKLRDIPNTLEGMEEAKEFLRAKSDEIKKVANANANTYTYADANTYTYANVDAYADANTYTYANADAYAYAKKALTAIADTAIETLRLAIEVTK